jgi:TonB family protein
MIVALLFAWLWQGAVFALAAWLAARSISRQNASTRYAVWYLAIGAIAIVPPLTCFVHLPADILPGISRSPAPPSFTYWLVPLDDVATHPAFPLAFILAIAWAAGTALCLLRLAVSYIRITRIRAAAVPLEDNDDVFISEELSIPIAAGFRRTAVIVPAALYKALSADELAGIIAHERAHIQRGDIPAHLLQRVIQALLFFNPWVHLAARNATMEREAACDDLAIERTKSSERYASALAHSAKLIGGRPEPLVTPGALTSPHAVVARIRRVLERRASPRITLNYYAMGGTMILFAVITLALQFMSPAMASTTPVASSPAAGTPALIASVAKACTTPNAGAAVTTPAPPVISKNAKGVHGVMQGSALVTIAPSGKVLAVRIDQSSGNTAVDQAILRAAKNSTYSPKIENCKPVEGSYDFFVRLNGNG